MTTTNDEPTINERLDNVIDTVAECRQMVEEIRERLVDRSGLQEDVGRLLPIRLAHPAVGLAARTP